MSVAIYAATIAPCIHLRIFAACVLASAGAQRSDGTGFALSWQQQTTAWLAGGARAALEIPLARGLALAVRADLVAPIVRTHLQVDGADVFAPSPVAGVFGLGLLGAAP